VGALVDLDAGDHPVVGHVLGKRHTVPRGLADRLIEQDRAGQVLVGVGRSQQQLAVGAPILFGAFDADAVETLLAGAGGLV